MPALWNEIRPKNYPSTDLPVIQLWKNYCNLSRAIPLGISTSSIRFFKKSSISSVLVELFYIYFGE